MEYKIQFGSLNSKPQQTQPGKTFRIAILGDFSGKGNSGRVEVGEALAARKPLRVSHENLDSLLSRLEVCLNLPAGASGAMMEVPIKCMDDFHPDQLYNNVPVFEKLVSLRQRLQDPTTFPKAAAAVQTLASAPIAIPSSSVTARASTSNAIPRGRIESFSDLIQLESRAHESAELKTLLRDVVREHVVAEMQGQAELIAAVDESLSDLMRRLLHHPDFQAMESLWRSLDMLIHRLDIDHELEVVLYDISAAEFAADLASSTALEDTGLYRWLVEAPALDASQGPLSLLVSNFVFEHIPPHAELLGRAAKIAACANAPFIASMDCSFLKNLNPQEIHPLVKESWEALRSLPEAVYLGLVTPRFMLRWPYGKKTEPIESFQLEEFTNKSGLSGMLWGNSALLVGMLLGQNFRDNGLAGMKLGAILSVDDIPFYYFNDQHGDQVALPCTERLINVRTAQQVTNQGVIPVLSIQGRSEVRLGGMHSANGAPLAGPWAPVSIQPGSAVAPIAAPIATPTPAAETPAAEPASPAPDAPPADEPQAAPAAEADDLDALLASLDDSSSSADSSDSDMDADLAALLADL
ncbi:MAG: type VI secretion system contractile sheath large subunit [Pirellulaceae bacterium]|nr:type VI secretion system contractile sheath large subunit [Pirellulaceae bacterium]